MSGIAGPCSFSFSFSTVGSILAFNMAPPREPPWIGSCLLNASRSRQDFHDEALATGVRFMRLGDHTVTKSMLEPFKISKIHVRI
jgi:hypothetical protein